jgi:hypothetical protein
MELTKGSKATHLTYGHGVIKSKAIHGYVNKDFNSEAKYDFLPDGGRFVMRVFESTLIPDPKPVRLTSEQKYQKACEDLKAKGCEVFTHDQNISVIFALDREPAALKVLTDLALAEGTLIVWTSPTTHDATVHHVATLCNLSLEEAESLVHRGSEKTENGGNRTVDGGSKYDLLLPNVSELVGLNERLGLYFNPGGKYANPQTIKIDKVLLTDYLMTQGLRPSLGMKAQEANE